MKMTREQLFAAPKFVGRANARMPQLQTIGVPTAEIGIDTLEDRLRKAAIEAGTAVGACSTPESSCFAAAHRRGDGYQTSCNR
jgi:hypothetical protein